MAFYIKSNEPEMNQSYYYSEDGGTLYTVSTNAKDYSTQSSAQAVIDKNDPFHWCFELKSKGLTLSVVEE